MDYLELLNRKEKIIDRDQVLQEISIEEKKLLARKVKHTLTKEEAKKEGKSFIMVWPLPKNTQESFDILFGLHAAHYSISEAKMFISKYNPLDKDAIKEELKEIEDFIQKANSFEDVEKYIWDHSDYRKRQYAVYKKLVSNSDYFKSLPFDKFPMLGDALIEVTVCGRYIYFRQWLNELYFKNYGNLIDDTKDIRLIIEKHIKCLSGKKDGANILEPNDYNRLLKYVIELAETGKTPKTIKPFSKILTNNFIKHTFYRLHFELYGNAEIKREWITFLHRVFRQFKGDEKATLIKFSQYAPNQIYDKDKESIYGY